MLIRTFLIKLTTRYDGKGMKEAEDDSDKLKKTTAKTKREVDGLDRSLDAEGRAAKKAGRATARAGQQIKTTGRQAKTTTRQVRLMDRVMGKAGAAIAALGPALAAAGLAALVAGVGKAISFVGDETARLDEIAKQSQKTGLGSDQYQLLSEVAKLAGTDVAALGKGTIKLTQNLRDITAGSVGPASRALADLGLEVEDLAGKTQTEQLAILADRFSKIEDDGLKSALAVDLLGKSGKELIPVFNQGADAINAAVDSVGRIFTPEELAKSEAYQDALTKLDKAVKIVTGSLAIGAAPTFQKFVELGEATIPVLTEMFDRLANKLAPAFRRLIDAARPMIERVLPDAEDGLGEVSGLLGNFADALAFSAETIAFFLRIGNTLITWVTDLAEALETRLIGALAPVGRAITDFLAKPLEVVRELASDVFDFVEGLVDGIGSLGAEVRSIKAAVGLGGGGGSLSSAQQAAAALQAGATSTTAQASARTQAQEAGSAARSRERVRQRDASNRGEAAGLRRRAAARGPRRPGGRGRAAAPEPTGGFLEQLDLNAPGSVLANRPAPQSLTIVIAPIIKLIEKLEINVTGGATEEQRRSLDDAAGQARDVLLAKLSDLPPVVENMFRLQAKSLQSAASSRTQPGGN